MRRRTDKDIRHDVAREIHWDTRTWDQDLKVDVAGGVVTLTGAADGQLVWESASTMVRNVPGVVSVVIQPLRPLSRRASAGRLVS